MARPITWLVVAVLSCASVYATTGSARGGRKPNIVYILADDLGWNDVGFHNPKVRTPNLDSLASKGIELTNSYAQPICSPSRSALMTGKYPSNNGLQHIVILAESKTCLPLEHQILPQYMKREGYATKYVGKWHLGYCNKRCLPKNRGIDEFRGMLGGECDYYNWEHNTVMLKNKNNRPTVENLGTHLTIQDTNDAREVIMAHRNNRKPLFLMISPTAPHVPLEPTPSMFNVHDFLNPNNNNTRARRQLLGLVSALDDLVGATMTALRDAGMADNTIIVFQSDNGGANIEPFFPGFPSHGNNYPLRNGKYSFYEGGTKVPTLYYDPRLNRRTRGTKRNFLMHISDWLPTFVHLANRGRNIRGIDGVSQITNLGNNYRSNNKYKKRSDMLVALTTIAAENFECSDRDAAFRWKDWKLIHANRVDFVDLTLTIDEWPKPAESPELPTITGDNCRRQENGEMVYRCLFNLKDDPSEQTNLYDQRPDIVSKLLAKINTARAEIKANVFTESLGVNSRTTRSFMNVVVPKHNYCQPSRDFPLRPNPSSCSASG